MSLYTIISMATDYLILGVAVAAIVALLFVAGYFVIYKRIVKGTRRLRPAQVVWTAVFVCYLVVVLCAVMFARGGIWGSSRVVPLFCSYRSAWYGASASEWRNLVLNILMFVPLGFLLPIGIKWFRICYRTYIAGLFGTVCIESAQYVLQRGICEIDDILNNTIGTMIGYGVFIVFWHMLEGIRRRKQAEEGTVGQERGKRITGLLLPQIPLAGTILAFAILFVLYQTNDLGSLDCQYVMAYDKDQFDISTQHSYSDKQGKAWVYQTRVYTQEETHKMAVDFFTKIGDTIDEGRMDLYDETAVYYSESGDMLWIDYIGGLYTYTNYDIIYGEEGDGAVPVCGVPQETICGKLAEYGIEPVEQAKFSQNGEGQYEFVVRQEAEDEKLLDGTISCSYYEEGLGEVANRLLVCEGYKEYDVISEREAYEQICEGEFEGALYVGEYHLNIELGAVRMGYGLDSKGFYQPVYVFSATINADPREIRVPALR